MVTPTRIDIAPKRTLTRSQTSTMAESLAALFEAQKPLKPAFKAVREAKGKATDAAEAGEAEEGPSSRGRRTKLEDQREARTIFVGNIPLSYSRRKIKQLFKAYGTVESVRLRSIAVNPGDLPVKVARRMFKQVGGTSLNAYVVLSTEEEAERCLALNETFVGGRHLRVDLATRPKAGRQQRTHSVFLGNLPFTVDEEQLREAFGTCGKIESVRVVRDSRTKIGKGFGFMKFKDRSGVVFAIKQNGKVEIDGRSVRVFRCKDMEGEEKVLSGGVKKPRFAGLQAVKPQVQRRPVRKTADGGPGGRTQKDVRDARRSGYNQRKARQGSGGVEKRKQRQKDK